MKARVIVISVLLLVLAPAVAHASLADEQRRGQELVAQLRSGATSCAQVSAEDFDQIGEYVMGRALGSTRVHQAMNDRMQLMLGDQGEQRMHELMGQRFAGCATGAGAGMMGMVGAADGDWGSMMRSGEWSWMMDSTWRSMSRQEWHRLQQQWLGAGHGSMRHEGWSAPAIVAVTLGGVMLVVLAVVAVTRRPFRRPPAAHAP